MKFILLVLVFLHLNDPELRIREFYDWYFELGKNELKPRFVELSNGKTGLDFSHVDSLMTKYHFSETFIQFSKSVYKECMTNLSAIPYSEFSKFEDIDDIENLGCNLQSYRWMNNAMEPYDHYSMIRSESNSDTKIKYTIKFSYEGTEKYQSTTEVTMQWKDGQWYIEKIE